MRRPLSQIVVAASLVGAAALLAPGCADNESLLVVVSNVVRSPPDCTAEADPSAAIWLAGTIDTDLRTSYDSTLLVANQLTARASRDQLRTETSWVTITGAEVRVLTPGGNQIDNFTVPSSGVIPPGLGDTPGYGLVYVPLLPDVTQYDEDINPLVAEVQVFGQTTGGRDVESSWFSYPVYRNNLVYFPSDAVNAATGACDQDANVDVPCSVGQDDDVPCNACQGYAKCAGTP